MSFLSHWLELRREEEVEILIPPGFSLPGYVLCDPELDATSPTRVVDKGLIIGVQ